MRDQVAEDLNRVLRFFEEPARLPAARGVALFACGKLGLFEVIPLPHVHRSRLAVRPVPLVGELVALEEEFGTMLAVACDRKGARFFEVTAYDVVELPGLTPAGRPDDGVSRVETAAGSRGTHHRRRGRGEAPHADSRGETASVR